MIRLLLVLLLLLAPASAEAVTYYVNASTGDDSRTTTQAQNSATPWLTLQHALTTGGGGNRYELAAGTYFRDYTPANSYDPCYNPPTGNSSNWTEVVGAAGETVVLDCNQLASANSQGSPVFGSSGRNYIKFQNVRVPPGEKKNVMITGNSENIWLEGIRIDHGPRDATDATHCPPPSPFNCAGFGNYYDVFIQDARYVTIQNSTFLNSYTTGTVGDQNAGGIVNFNGRNLSIRFNEFRDVGQCMEDKRGGQDNLWEYNYCIGNPGGKGFGVFGFNDASCSAWNCSVQRITFRYNVLRGDGVGTGTLAVGIQVSLSNSGSQDHRDFTIHNNTIFRVNRAFRMTFPMPNPRFYNNAASIDGNTDPFMQQHGAASAPDNHPSTDLISDRNCYRRINGTPLQFDASETGGGSAETLATWQSTGSSDHSGISYDTNAVAVAGGTAMFQTESTTDGAVTELRLIGGSACIGLGRANADGTGATLDTGAFATASTPGPGGESVAPPAPGQANGKRPRRIGIFNIGG